MPSINSWAIYSNRGLMWQQRETTEHSSSLLIFFLFLLSWKWPNQRKIVTEQALKTEDTGTETVGWSLTQSESWRRKDNMSPASWM